MMEQLDHLVPRVVQRLRGRYYGKYRGIVIDNNDPSNLGRIRATVASLCDAEPLGWALPAFAYGGATGEGFFAIPEPHTLVWIEFEEGYLNHPIWSGTLYASGAIPESAPVTKKVLKTKSGHKIVLDDDAKSLEITDANGNTISMDQGDIKVTAGQATKVTIDAPQIVFVAGSSHPVVLGDELLNYLTQLVNMLNTHMHPGELAAGIFPVTPMVPAPPLQPPTPSILSQKVTTG